MVTHITREIFAYLWNCFPNMRVAAWRMHFADIFRIAHQITSSRIRPRYYLVTFCWFILCSFTSVHVCITTLAVIEVYAELWCEHVLFVNIARGAEWNIVTGETLLWLYADSESILVSRMVFLPASIYSLCPRTAGHTPPLLCTNFCGPEPVSSRLETLRYHRPILIPDKRRCFYVAFFLISLETRLQTRYTAMVFNMFSIQKSCSLLTYQ